MLKKLALGTLLFSSLIITAQAEISIGDLSARLDDLEKRGRGENALGDELATKNDVESLATAVKMLTGRIEILEHQMGKKLSEKGSMTSLESAADPLSKAAVDHLDPEPRKIAGDPVVLDDNADVDAVLESLGASIETPKAILKEKTEEKREKATEKAEQTTTSVLDSGSPAAQFNQAKALLNNKQYAEAEEAFKEYLTTYPANKEVKPARIHLGEAQLKQGKSDEAKSTFAKAYQANSKGSEGAQALLGLGESLAAKDKKKACVVLKKLKEDFPENKPTIGRANELLKKYNCS